MDNNEAKAKYLRSLSLTGYGIEQNEIDSTTVKLLEEGNLLVMSYDYMGDGEWMTSVWYLNKDGSGDWSGMSIRECESLGNTEEGAQKLFDAAK